MKNHLNILPKLASFDLKCSKMRGRRGPPPSPRCGSLRRPPSPPNRKRQRAFGARHSLFRVHFYISIPLSGPPYGIPGSATACFYFQEGHHGPDWRPWQDGSGLRALVWRPLRYSNITSRNLCQRNGYSWLKLYKVLQLNIDVATNQNLTFYIVS